MVFPATLMTTIHKPRTLGIMTKVEHRRQGPVFVVAVLGLFSLRDGIMFENEQALWPMALKEMPQGAFLDLVMPKPCGEVLVAGRAVAPDQQPVRAMTVDIQVGTLAKRIAVFGDRAWQPNALGATFTEPQPFIEMPLTPDRSFGGPGHAGNPAGQGFGAAPRVNNGKLVLLPNVEDARRLIRTVNDQPAPVRLGPIDPGSAERQKYAGTYNDDWLKRDFPGLPQDVDPRLFMMATEDQWIDGYFRGDEPLLINGMSATEPVIRGRLPGLRARAFAERTSAPAGLFEIPLVLDTVWLFGSAGKGVLIYRGVLGVSDIDAKDVAKLLLAYERLADEPREPGYYAEVLRLRSDEATAHKYVLADSQLTPHIPEAEIARRRQAREAYAAEQAERFQSGQQMTLRRMAEQMGVPAALMPAPSPPPPLPMLLPTPAEIASGDLDLAELFDGADAMIRDVLKMADRERSNADGIKAAAGPVKDGSTDAIDRLLGMLNLPDTPGIGAQVDAVLANLQQGLTPGEGDGLPINDALTAQLDELTARLSGGFVAKPPDEEDQFRDARARFLGLPESSLLAKGREGLGSIALPSFDQSGERSAAEPTPRLQDILAAMEQGRGDDAADSGAQGKMAAADESLRKIFPQLPSQDGGMALDAIIAALAPGDAAGGDQDPHQATADGLARARTQLDDMEKDVAEGIGQLRLASPEATYPVELLTPAVARRLGDLVLHEIAQGASLAGRDLAGADLAGADLTGADLTGAFLERAQLQGARLGGARAARAVFTSAVLDGADLTGADLSEANLSKASLQNARMANAVLSKSTMLHTVLTGVDLTGATIEDITLIEGNLAHARFDGARLHRSMIIKTPMTAVSLAQASVEHCIFMECEATQADFRGMRAFQSIFLKLIAPQSDFSGADMGSTAFLGAADLAASRFDEARAIQATFQGANLAGASFARAQFDRAVLSEANLDGAILRLAGWRGALFGQATMTGVDAFGANFHSAQLRRADLSGAQMRAANLYSCDLSDAKLTAVDFTAANLAKTNFLMPANAPV